MRKLGLRMAIIAVLFCVAALGVSRLRAQEPRKQEELADSQVLSDSGLSRMLTGMGYEPKKLKQGCLVSIKQGEWTYNIQFVISPSREKIGLNANVGAIEDPSTVTANQWMDILVANADTAPSFFYYNKNTHILYLHRVIDNRSLTPAILSRQIDAFTNNIKNTAEVWKFTK
jgi:hypothetical protein